MAFPKEFSDYESLKKYADENRVEAKRVICRGANQKPYLAFFEYVDEKDRTAQEEAEKRATEFDFLNTSREEAEAAAELYDQRFQNK